MAELNHPRRKTLKKNFQDKTGLPAIIQLSGSYVSKNPKGYLASYTHYLEAIIIEYEKEIKDLMETLKK